MKSLSG